MQKFAHGMKSKRNSSFSGKNSLKMQSARPSGPKLDYFFYFFLFFLIFPYFFFFAIFHYFWLVFLIVSYVLLFSFML